MSRPIPKNASPFPKKLEFESAQYKEYREYLKTRMGPAGLSLCTNHKIAYNFFWREKHRNEFPSCKILLPKEWIPDDKFVDVLIDLQMFEGDNTIVRPTEFDEDEELPTIRDTQSPKTKTLIDLIRESETKKRNNNFKTVKSVQKAQNKLEPKPKEGSLVETNKNDSTENSNAMEIEMLKLRFDNIDLKMNNYDLRLKTFEVNQQRNEGQYHDGFALLREEVKQLQDVFLQREEPVSNRKRKADVLDEPSLLELPMEEDINDRKLKHVKLSAKQENSQPTSANAKQTKPNTRSQANASRSSSTNCINSDSKYS